MRPICRGSGTPTRAPRGCSGRKRSKQRCNSWARARSCASSATHATRSPARCAWPRARSWVKRCRRAPRSGRHWPRRPYDTEGLSLGISAEQRLTTVRRWSAPKPSAERTYRLPTIAGLAAWALAALAAFYGQSLAFSPRPEDARPWLLAAAALGFVGVRLLEVGFPGGDAKVETPAMVTVGRKRRLGGLAIMGLGGMYALMATALVQVRAPESAATWVWLFGVGSAVVGATLVSGRPRWNIAVPKTRTTWIELGAILAIVAVALWLRLPDLATLPPNLHGDEVSIGLDARRVLNGEMPAVFAVGWYEVPALSFTLHAATMALFGDNLFGLRLASLTESLISIVLLYLLTRRLWGSRPALLAAAFMTGAAWH